MSLEQSDLEYIQEFSLEPFVEMRHINTVDWLIDWSSEWHLELVLFQLKLQGLWIYTSGPKWNTALAPSVALPLGVYCIPTLRMILCMWQKILHEELKHMCFHSLMQSENLHNSRDAWFTLKARFTLRAHEFQWSLDLEGLYFIQWHLPLENHPTRWLRCT